MGFKDHINNVVPSVTSFLGSPYVVVGSAFLVAAWALTGPIMGFSDTWQLLINTTTTILTFNMVFVIQNSQNRDGKAVQVKLDAILEAVSDKPDKELLEIEDKPEEEITKKQEHIINHTP